MDVYPDGIADMSTNEDSDETFSKMLY